MGSIAVFLKKELENWRTAEVLWVVFCLLATLVISIFAGDDPVGIVAALTGIAYTLLAGKGKISCYFFGVINTLLYSYVSWQNRFWGEVMLNLLWYLPMMFCGAFFWRRNMDKNSVVLKRSLSISGKLICLFFVAAGIVLYALFLKYLKGSQVFTDSATTVMSITAMILTVRRCSEQWWLWTAVNILSIVMWFRAWQGGTGSAAVLCMWMLALANGIIFYIQWSRSIKNAG